MGLIGAPRLEDVPIAGYSELFDKTPKTIYKPGASPWRCAGTLSDSDTAVVANAATTLMADLSHPR